MAKLDNYDGSYHHFKMQVPFYMNQPWYLMAARQAA